MTQGAGLFPRAMIKRKIPFLLVWSPSLRMLIETLSSTTCKPQRQSGPSCPAARHRMRNEALGLASLFNVCGSMFRRSRLRMGSSYRSRY
ncbi:hypothetical protein L228DRAFT_141085 [Xylona heveae TC161]|uniref:Uncharacterized protein n=1 Tax=Xylona heveae (strain CBS 132557 / TC161) TaxID=1328760 RepID=A0A165H506_XYLHT|nr:hypothetical protein L228DRAFT_141085 [Xylona heveae TC161]KZF22991.1 hypothetical protein L228DRAFT_141085 [Xylona heveae TC161]